MLSGACHCGAVKINYDGAPQALVHCNCSICRRLGAVWGHGTTVEISVDAAPDATLAYLWGDRELAFHSCRTCGCTTHWVSVSDKSAGRMALNMNLMESDLLEGLRVRHFDGADSWTFLD